MTSSLYLNSRHIVAPHYPTQWARNRYQAAVHNGSEVPTEIYDHVLSLVREASGSPGAADMARAAA